MLLSKSDDAISKDKMSEEELLALQTQEELNRKINSLKNNAVALRDSGLDYFYGRGVKQDYKIAFRYLQLASKLGDKDAQVYLSAMYLEGLGVKKDINKSEYWNKKFLETP